MSAVREVRRVYRETTLVGKSKWGHFVAGTGEKGALQDVNSERFDLRVVRSS